MPVQGLHRPCSPQNIRRRVSQTRQLSSIVLAVAFDLVRRHTLQPDLAPIGIDRAWTEAAADRIARLANDILEDDRVGLEADHLAGTFIDDLLLPPLDLILTLGERHHFGVE